MSQLISDKFDEWKKLCDQRFDKLKANEEKLNSFFIDIYGIGDELTPEVDERYVSVRKAELQREIKSLISYAVGCIFGRYSLDKDGLCYAGGEWDTDSYRTIIPCSINILPVNDVNEGLTAEVISFFEKAYGSDTLEANLNFIAEALSGDGDSRTVIHKYLQKDFFSDHVKIYKKRPIYWMFSSGSKGAFRAIIYIHRYDSELLTVLENEYAAPRYEQLKKELSELDSAYKHSSASQKAELRKKISRSQALILEMEGFMHSLHNLALQKPVLDLDDGVKANYEKLRNILAQ